MLRRLAAVPAAALSSAALLISGRLGDAGVTFRVAVAARCDVIGVAAAGDAGSIDGIHLEINVESFLGL